MASLTSTASGTNYFADAVAKVLGFEGKLMLQQVSFELGIDALPTFCLTGVVTEQSLRSIYELAHNIDKENNPGPSVESPDEIAELASLLRASVS